MKTRRQKTLTDIGTAKEEAVSAIGDAKTEALTAVATDKDAAAKSATDAADSATLARSYARGDTATRDGEDTDNAKYYMEQAQKAALGNLDDKMSDTSENAVKNMVIKAYVDSHVPDLSDATTEASGLMSAEDKAKLDGIAEGATKDDLTPYAKTADVNTSLDGKQDKGDYATADDLAKKGDTLSYADSTLKLLSGETVLSEVTIEGGAALIQVKVTFDKAFKGAEYSITGGDESYTGTVPDGLVVIQKVKSYNTTYTVKSTANSREYTSTVATGQYAGEYATVLNTFGWRGWVNSARFLNSTDYNSLSDVLADEEAVRQLFLVHDCVDYLADISTANKDVETIINTDLAAKWINLSDYALDTFYANTIIKGYMDTADKYFYGEWVITDDTTTPPTWGPKGNVPIMTSNTTPYGTASAYQVFDGNASTTASGTDFSYKFVNPICPKDFYCNVSGGTLQASNDGSTWSVPTSGSYYLYLRLHFASSVSPHTLQFYGRELSVSVPTMTGNTTPYGEAFGSTPVTSDVDCWKAFNGSNDGEYSTWASNIISGEDYIGYIGYTFTSKIVPRMVVVKNRVFSRDPNCRVHTFKIQGSDTGNSNDWHDITDVIDRGTAANASGYGTTHIINGTTPYKMLRMLILSDFSQSGITGVAILQFYGLDYSEKEFETGTTKKWLYDHGVELETLDFGTAVKGDSYVYFNHINTSVLTDEINPHSKIDLTPYSRVRIKTVGRNVWVAVYSTYGHIAISNAKNIDFRQWSGFADISLTLIQSYAPNNISYDISSFNEEKYILIGSTDATVRKWDISEWWLE